MSGGGGGGGGGGGWSIFHLFMLSSNHLKSQIPWAKGVGGPTFDAESKSSNI